MSWATQTRNFEIKYKEKKELQSIFHVWLTKKPSDEKQKRIMEMSLFHLGVKIAWLDDWGQIIPVLGNLLSVEVQ